MASNTDDVAQGSRYVIPGNNPEKQRLLEQYKLKKDYYGWNEAVPDSVDLSGVHTVLEIAAGSCAWTLDLARHPAIAPRLGQDLQFYACDIDTRFFSEISSEAIDITTFQQDVTKPFAPEMHNKFDLARVSLLALCLTQSGWQDALRNSLTVLKPGGLFVIDDIDPVLYAGEQHFDPDRKPGHDLASCMSGSGWIPKANVAYTGWALASDFVTDLSFQMPHLLSEAGFHIIDHKRGRGCHGKLCYTLKGADGRDLARWADLTVENMVFILAHFASAMLERNILVSPSGQKISTSDEVDAMLQEIRTGLIRDGALSYGVYCLAKKPN